MKKYTDRYSHFLENISLPTLKNFSNYVAPNVHFRDPFHDTIGANNMQLIFSRLLKTMNNVEFSVISEAINEPTYLITWHFSAEFRGKCFSFNGASEIIFSPDGLVIEHIDYWDAATNVYQHIPIIGRLILIARYYLSS